MFVVELTLVDLTQLLWSIDAFFDYNLANKTVEQLAIAKGMGTPFFIAAGIRRPHRVWHVPRRFYNLYANNGTFPTDMPLAKFKTGPVGMPEIAYIDNAWPPFPYNQVSAHHHCILLLLF